MQPCVQGMVHEGFARYRGSCTMYFIAIKCNSSWVDCTESRVYQVPSNTVLNENYLFKEQLGKLTYRPNAFQPLIYFNKCHTVSHAKNLKWHQLSKCTKSFGNTCQLEGIWFWWKRLESCFPKVILTRSCVRETFCNGSDWQCESK